MIARGTGLGASFDTQSGSGDVGICRAAVSDRRALQADVRRGAQRTQTQGRCGGVANIAGSAAAGPVGHGNAAGRRFHIDGPGSGSGEIPVIFLGDSAGGQDRNIAAAAVQRRVQPQGSGHIHAHVAGARGGKSLIDTEVAAGGKHQGAVSGRRNPGQGRSIGYRIDSPKPVDTDRCDSVQGQSVALAQEYTARCGLSRQQTDVSLDSVSTGADAGAGIQAQVGGGNVDGLRVKAISIAVENRPPCLKADMAGTGGQFTQSDGAPCGLNALIAVVGQKLCFGLHGNRVRRQPVDRLPSCLGLHFGCAASRLIVEKNAVSRKNTDASLIADNIGADVDGGICPIDQFGALQKNVATGVVTDSVNATLCDDATVDGNQAHVRIRAGKVDTRPCYTETGQLANKQATTDGVFCNQTVDPGLDWRRPCTDAGGRRQGYQGRISVQVGSVAVKSVGDRTAFCCQTDRTVRLDKAQGD